MFVFCRPYTQYVQAATGEILAATTGNLEDLASPTSEGLLQEHYSPSTDISVLQCDEQLDCKISVDTALNTSSGMEVGTVTDWGHNEPYISGRGFDQLPSSTTGTRILCPSVCSSPVPLCVRRRAKLSDFHQ